MAKHILLYHPQTQHERNYKFFWIPYSLLGIAAPLYHEGYRITIWDNNLNRKSDYRNDFRNILDECICVGVSSMIGHQIVDGLAFSRQVRETNPRIPIVWGGALPTLLPRTTLENDCIDFIVRGQGESGFLGLIRYLSKEQKTIPKSVGYKINGNLVEGQHYPPEEKEKFPRYPFEIINVEKYVRNDPHINTRVLNYVSSQGCPFGCGFCTDTSMYKRKWAALTANRTAGEIKYLVETYNLNGIKFYDSNFFVNKKRAVEFASRISEDTISWAASAHPKNLLNLSSKELQILKQSGLTRLLIGAESGVQKELDFIGKGIKVGDIVELADLLDKKDIIASFTFIVGYPAMPIENIEITLKFAEKLASKYRKHEYKIHIYLPFPGTFLYKMAKDCGFLPPQNLEGWARLDYYERHTPWVSEEYEMQIRTFNETYCPYVS